MEALIEFLNSIECEKPSNCTKVFFSRRTSNTSSQKYITHEPAASNNVQFGILDTIFPYIKKQLEEQIVVTYNPTGVVDGEIERINAAEIPMLPEFLLSISDDQINKDMSSMKVDQIGFYCISVSYNESTLYCFRQFQKLKKLRQGYITRIIDNELNAIDGDFLGIDEFTDIIVFADKVYLLNHISLERIFNYRDEFLKKTNEALGEILSKDVISNIEQFAEDCRSDVRIMKRFTSIMTKDRLPLFFDNYERVPDIVKELGLDIDFAEDGKLVYRERSQLFHIINLLSDAYFKSLLAQRPGIAKIEGEL